MKGFRYPWLMNPCFHKRSIIVTPYETELNRNSFICTFTLREREREALSHQYIFKYLFGLQASITNYLLRSEFDSHWLIHICWFCAKSKLNVCIYNFKFSVTVIVSGNGHGELSSNPTRDCVSIKDNAQLWVNSKQTGLSNIWTATNLREGKLWIQTGHTWFKNWPSVALQVVLISLFNPTSTFLGYLMPKQSL